MSRLHLHILGSGSKGNCALIEGPQGLIMVDDGLSRRETLKRMAELGLSTDNVSALLITHEHSDHIKGLDVWCKALARPPLFASRGTLSNKENLSHLPVEEFDPGDALSIAGIHVQTYSTSHDVINPVGYRFDALDDSIGFATDTGELSSQAMNTLKDCRVLALESNHDVTMLREGEYPRFLQERILSARGHPPMAKPPKPRANLLPIAPNSSLPCISAKITIVRALPSKAMPKALAATLDDEVGSSATLLQGSRKLSIRPASQYQPATIQ
ncbi:MAG: MBL fold metallo-hydrolase [Collinsella sp.]